MKRNFLNLAPGEEIILSTPVGTNNLVPNPRAKTICTLDINQGITYHYILENELEDYSCGRVNVFILSECFKEILMM